MIVLVESSFWLRFRSTIQFLPLWSMDDKAEAEPKSRSEESRWLNLTLHKIICFISGPKYFFQKMTLNQ